METFSNQLNATIKRLNVQFNYVKFQYIYIYSYQRINSYIEK